MAKATLTVEVHYNKRITDPESLATAMDRLLEMALSTPGILDDYGNPRVGEFFVANADGNLPAMVVVEIAGGVLQQAYSSDPTVQLVRVDWDTEGCEPGKAKGIFQVTGQDGRARCAAVACFPTLPMDRIPDSDTGVALEAAGIACQTEPEEGKEIRRWVIYDLDTDALLTSRAYSSYEEACEDANQVNDALVLPLVCKGF
jgi:hypothetical protein